MFLWLQKGRRVTRSYGRNLRFVCVPAYVWMCWYGRSANMCEQEAVSSVCLGKGHSGGAVSSWQAHLEYHPVWHTAGPDVCECVHVCVGWPVGPFINTFGSSEDNLAQWFPVFSFLLPLLLLSCWHQATNMTDSFRNVLEFQYVTFRGLY